jgi:alpha-glucosidase
VLAFRRDIDDRRDSRDDDRRDGRGFVCTVNLTGGPVTLPTPGRELLTSGAPARAVTAKAAGRDGSDAGTADRVTIAADTAVWWAV